MDNQIDSLARERMAERSALEDKISRLEKFEKEASEKAQAAAENGDVKGYKAAHNDAQEYEAQLAVAKIMYEKQRNDNLLSRDEAASIWKEYSEKYEKAFDKLYAVFQKKRDDMLEAYREIVNIQAEAIENRERLAEYIGESIVHICSVWDRPYDDLFPMKCLPTEQKGSRLRFNGSAIHNPDALYFFAKAADDGALPWEDQRLRKLIGIIERHTIKFL